MWLLGRKVLDVFTPEAGLRGWEVDIVDDDDIVVYTRPQASEISVALGLDLTPRDYGLSLNPRVSIRHERVARLDAEFAGVERGASLAGSLIYDLMDKAARNLDRWVVSDFVEAPQVVQNVFSDFAEYGEPFVAKHATLRDLVEKLDADFRVRPNLERLAVASAVLQEWKVTRYSLLELEKIARQEPPFVSEQMNQFITRLRVHFNLLTD